MEHKKISINLSTTAITLILIILKLCSVISWSWLWVLSPLWIGWIIGLIAMAIAFLAVIMQD